ncbi:hypothetical protein EN35_11810 [Rhodococcus qingshengii]|nr:hypothetical protein EN35_11810 [Rhodococcus qingshengii]
MIGCAASLSTEKDQVAVFQFTTFDWRCITQVIHFIRRTRNTNFHQIFISVINQASCNQNRYAVSCHPNDMAYQLLHQFIHCHFRSFLHLALCASARVPDAAFLTFTQCDL